MAVAQGAAIYAHMLEVGNAPKAIRQSTGMAAEQTAGTSETVTLQSQVPTAEETQPDDESGFALRVVSDDSAADGGAQDEIETAGPALPNVRFVTAHGVGVRTERDGIWRNSVLIPKNSQVPIEVTKRFVTTSKRSGGTFINILVTQGDTPDIGLAEVLGQGRIEGFAASEPPGQPVDVVMRFDEFGRLHIRAIYANTGQELQMDLEIPGGLRQEEVDRQREHLENTPLLGVYSPDPVSEEWEAEDGEAEDHEDDEDDDRFVLNAE